MTLSVVMTNYNHSAYLGDALEAITTQSLQPTEFIIVDDGSTDNSIEIIEEFRIRFPYIKLFKNEKNMGIIHSANFALRKASSTYVISCAADDCVMPGCFEKGVAMLEKHPQRGMCLSKFCIFDGDDLENSRTIGKLLASEKTSLSPEEFMKKVAWNHFPMPGFSAVIRNQCLQETDLLIPELGPLGDWFFFHTIAFRYGICFIPEVLGKARMHPQAFSIRNSNNHVFYSKSMRHLNDLLKSRNYSDVREAFIRTGIVSSFGIGTFPALFQNREFINYNCLRFYLIFFLKKIKGILNGFFPFLRKLKQTSL